MLLVNENDADGIRVRFERGGPLIETVIPTVLDTDAGDVMGEKRLKLVSESGELAVVRLESLDGEDAEVFLVLKEITRGRKYRVVVVRHGFDRTKPMFVGWKNGDPQFAPSLLRGSINNERNIMLLAKYDIPPWVAGFAEFRYLWNNNPLVELRRDFPHVFWLANQTQESASKEWRKWGSGQHRIVINFDTRGGGISVWIRDPERGLV